MTTRFAALLPLCLLAACGTMNTGHGPGMEIPAEATSISFNHPVYKGGEATYHRRASSGGTNAIFESGDFSSNLGQAWVTYARSNGDTYLSMGSLDNLAEELGEIPEKNQVVGSGRLPDRVPPVEWIAFDIATKAGKPVSCVAIKRNANNSFTAGSWASGLITAVDCRTYPIKLGADDAALLSDAIRTK